MICVDTTDISHLIYYLRKKKVGETSKNIFTRLCHLAMAIVFPLTACVFCQWQ